MQGLQGRRVILSSEAMFQEIGGEGVILDLASASYFGLDDVGARLWRLLESDTHLDKACETLLREYAVDPDVLERDIQTLVTQLVAAGLVKVE